MKLFKYLLSFALAAFLTSSVFCQSKLEEEEDQSYLGIEIPGYVSVSASLTVGSLRGRYIINQLVLNGQSKDYMLPEFDVEVGVVDRLSLEVVTGYRKIVSSASLNAPMLKKGMNVSKTADGLNSIMLGANVGLLKEHKLRPAMYLQNQFYLPETGHSNFQIEQLGYFAALNMENTISDVTCLDYSLGVGWDGIDPYAIYDFNINPNFNVTDNIVAYADFGGIFSKYSNPVNLLDIGTTITFSDLFSLDAYVGNELQTKNFGKSTFGALKFTFDFNAFAK